MKNKLIYLTLVIVIIFIVLFFPLLYFYFLDQQIAKKQITENLSFDNYLNEQEHQYILDNLNLKDLNTYATVLNTDEQTFNNLKDKVMEQIKNIDDNLANMFASNLNFNYDNISLFKSSEQYYTQKDDDQIILVLNYVYYQNSDYRISFVIDEYQDTILSLVIETINNSFDDVIFNDEDDITTSMGDPYEQKTTSLKNGFANYLKVKNQDLINVYMDDNSLILSYYFLY